MGRNLERPMTPRIAIAVSAGEREREDARAKYRTAIELAGGQPALIEPPPIIAEVLDDRNHTR